MKKTILSSSFLILLLWASACQQKVKQWTPIKTIDLGELTPIGLTYANEQIWLADGDNNRVVSINKAGVVQQTLTGFERPMHLDSQEGIVYVPEYGTDNILKLQGEKRDTLSLAKADSLDAPAGVSVLGDEIAIADFYNHRILYFNGSQWQSFGKEGKAEGEFYYPTDVQVTQDKIYIADAYNNRVQVLNKTGGVEQIIGVEEKMNATTGLYVSENQLFATDFENDRVLVYDLTGKLQQIISENVTKPTDMLMIDQQLYVCSYKDKALLVYER